MAINRGSATAEKNTSSEYVNLEEREYDMRLVYIADLGMQKREYMGDTKPDCQCLALGFEVINEFVVIDGEEFPRIMWSKPFNVFATLTERGKELSFYKVFNPKAKDGDVPKWEDYLGAPCSGLIENVEGKGKNEGKLFDNLASISAIPEKYRDDVGMAITPPCVGDADDPENPCTQALFGLVKWKFDQRVQ